MAANVKGKKVIRRRREKKNVEKGQVHIRSSFNNPTTDAAPPSVVACNRKKEDY